MSSPGPISLSFGGPARKARRLDLHGAEKKVEKQEILGFDESGIIQTASTSAEKEDAADKLVISAQPNTYRWGAIPAILCIHFMVYDAVAQRH